MNNLNKNPDAHRRLARGVQRFSRAYMKLAEFKSRQSWLDFKDSIGTALESICEAVDASRKHFMAWQKKFISKKKEPLGPVQTSFNFLSWIDMHITTTTTK